MQALRDRVGSVREATLRLVVRIGVVRKGLLVGIRSYSRSIIVVVVVEGFVKVAVIMLSVSLCRMARLRLSIRLGSKPVKP